MTGPPSGPAPLAHRARSWGRLLRISLLPSPLADVAAGAVLGAGAWPAGPAPFVLALGSACVFHGALALNDWADRDWDATTRPERPLPAGEIRAGAALTLAATALILGVGLAFLAGGLNAPSPASSLAPLALGTAAVLALAYDLGPRGPRLGPLLLASCRASNLLAGFLLGSGAAAPSGAPVWMGLSAAAANAIYLFEVARLGRLEDAEDEPESRSPSALLTRMAAALLLAGSLGAAAAVVSEGRVPNLRELAPLALAGSGAFGLVRLSRRRTWERADVVAAMGAALRRLLVFTASCALLSAVDDGIWVAAAILAGYPLSYVLRRVAPPS